MVLLVLHAMDSPISPIMPKTVIVLNLKLNSGAPLEFPIFNGEPRCESEARTQLNQMNRSLGEAALARTICKNP